MPMIADRTEPMTTADVVFDTLNKEIATLELKPGARISETEVASRLGVSRQPVRDAFNRLAHLGLLHIRPQRPTRVRGFSMPEIENARFIRLSVELEVMARACTVWDADRAAKLDANLALQTKAVESGKPDALHQLDYEFHRLICTLSGHPLAFETIEACKHKVDRLCQLSFESPQEISAVLDDHMDIARQLLSRSVDETRATMQRHLRRLDATIDAIHKEHAEYFI